MGNSLLSLQAGQGVPAAWVNFASAATSILIGKHCAKLRQGFRIALDAQTWPTLESIAQDRTDSFFRAAHCRGLHRRLACLFGFLQSQALFLRFGFHQSLDLFLRSGCE